MNNAQSLKLTCSMNLKYVDDLMPHNGCVGNLMHYFDTKMTLKLPKIYKIICEILK